MQLQSLIALLDESSTEVMRQLRQKHPASKDILTSARELGDSSETNFKVDRRALLDLVQASLIHVKQSLDELATTIHKRMKSISRIKLVGALVASVSGGAGAVLTYIGLGHELIVTAGAFIAMLGGIVGLFADYFERAPSGLRIAAIDEYAKLIGMIGEVELIKLQVDRDSVLPVFDEQLRTMLEKLDGYSLQIIRLRRA